MTIAAAAGSPSSATRIWNLVACGYRERVTVMYSPYFVRTVCS